MSGTIDATLDAVVTVLRPGDRVLISPAHGVYWSQEQQAVMAQRVRAAFGDDVRFAVVGSDLQVHVVRDQDD